MTLWQVADEATRDLMISWYTQLQDGVPRGEALRAIQLAVLRGEALPATGRTLTTRGVTPIARQTETADAESPGAVHPFFWASIILSGETGPVARER